MKLIAALNKFWRPITENYFWDKMDWNATLDAISVSGMTEEVFNMCFQSINKPSIKISRHVSRN